MKIASRNVTFLPSMPWPTRRGLNFGRSGSSLHLQETALVVEGCLQRLFFPVLDRFFQQALSEWTAVTVPYSRILQYGYDSRLLARILLTSVLCIPLALLGLAGAGLLVLPMGLLVLVLSLIVFSPRSWILYRQADGGKAIICFHIGSSKRRREFEETLEKNRAASRDRARQEELTPEERGADTPLVVLMALLAGYLGAEWYRMWSSPFSRAFGVGNYLQRGAELLVEGLPILLLAAALVYRGWTPRLLAAAALLVRGLMPVAASLAAPGAFTGREFEIFAVALFHVILAGVLLAGPAGEKGVRR